MRVFLRDNVAIVVGVSLPLVVVLLFVLATYVPRAYVEPPRHDLLLVAYNYNVQTRPERVDLRVTDGRLDVRAYKLDVNGNTVYGQPLPRLFLWSHESRSIHEISLDIPSLETLANGAAVAVPELAQRRLGTDLRAPDGYEYRAAGYGGSGLFGMFFDRSSQKVVLQKNGATEELRMPGDVPYWNAQFLAWVVE